MLTPKLKTHIGKLKQKKYRKEFGEFIVEGVKGVEEALKGGEVLGLVVEGNKRDEEDIIALIRLAESKAVGIEYAGRNDIGGIKSTDTFPGVLAICEVPESVYESIVNDKPIIFLDTIKDPGNLGTIIRTADWFGIPNVILSEESVDPYNEKVVRSTMGSIFRANILESESGVRTLEKLKKEGYTIVALSMNKKPLKYLKPVPKMVYVFGSESHGISEEVQKVCTETYMIEGQGGAESLNVAVSVGIVLANI